MGLQPAYLGPFYAPTLAGDATLDGKVYFNDLVKLAQNYNTTFDESTVSWWFNGDFTNDGKVDFNKLRPLARRGRNRNLAIDQDGRNSHFDGRVLVPTIGQLHDFTRGLDGIPIVGRRPRLGRRAQNLRRHRYGPGRGECFFNLR